MDHIKLDLTKLLGFKIIANDFKIKDNQPLKTGAKIGSKPGLKTSTFKIGAKIGSKPGLKTSTFKIGAKIGKKPGVKRFN